MVGVLCADPARCLVESNVWWAEFNDAAGRTVRRKASRDRAAAEALALRWATEARQIRAGILHPDGAVRREVGELLDAWRDHLAGRRGSIEHPTRQRARVERVLTSVGASRPEDLTPAKVMRAVNGFPCGSTTRAHHVRAVKAFTRWLHRSDRSESTDHLAGLSVETDATDRRHVRRVLEPGEFGRLLDAARAGKRVWHLTGPDREALYLVAASTGLRASELASLTADSFALDGTPPTVTVEAAYSKRRRRDVVPVPRSILTRLRAFLAGRAGVLWPGSWRVNGADMIRRDLAAAGIPYKDARGHVYDLHALRSQYITDLDSAGVSLPDMQQLARHSTPVLTSRYTKRTVGDLARGADKLRR